MASIRKVVCISYETGKSVTCNASLLSRRSVIAPPLR